MGGDRQSMATTLQARSATAAAFQASNQRATRAAWVASFREEWEALTYCVKNVLWAKRRERGFLEGPSFGGALCVDLSSDRSSAFADECDPTTTIR
jgi:hypothetical protein